MFATVILGILIAAIFAVGMRNIYNNFFKGESTCCKGECSSGCPMAKANENYRDRVEAIEKFKLKKTINVEGMTCNHCTATVEKALEKIDGVAIVAASVEKKSVEAAFDHEVADDILKDAIRKAGYQPGAVATI